MTVSVVIRIVLATAHVGLVAFIVYCLLEGSEPDWPMYWALVFLVDFPLGHVCTLIGKSSSFFGCRELIQGIDSPLNDVPNFLFPLFLFGIFGTGWWFSIPVLIGALV